MNPYVHITNINLRFGGNKPCFASINNMRKREVGQLPLAELHQWRWCLASIETLSIEADYHIFLTNLVYQFFQIFSSVEPHP